MITTHIAVSSAEIVRHGGGDASKMRRDWLSCGHSTESQSNLSDDAQERRSIAISQLSCILALRLFIVDYDVKVLSTASAQGIIL